MSHDKVLEASVVAVPHEKWQERPVACVVLKEGQAVGKEELYALLEAEFPKTSVGKFLKRALHDQLKTYMVEKTRKEGYPFIWIAFFLWCFIKYLNFPLIVWYNKIKSIWGRQNGATGVETIREDEPVTGS